MEKSKKLLTLFTIVSTCVVSILLIMLLFEINLFGNSNINVIITFACFGIGGFFALNSLNMLDKNRLIGYVSLGLIIASVFLIILSSWIDIGSGVLLNITISLGLLSVLFNIIVSSSLDLGKRNFIIQIIVFVIVGLFDIITTLGLFGVINLLDILAWYIALIIITILGVIILKVLARKKVSELLPNKNKIIISKEEYDILCEKAKKYDELSTNSKKNN